METNNNNPQPQTFADFPELNVSNTKVSETIISQTLTDQNNNLWLEVQYTRDVFEWFKIYKEPYHTSIWDVTKYSNDKSLPFYNSEKEAEESAAIPINWNETLRREIIYMSAYYMRDHLRSANQIFIHPTLLPLLKLLDLTPRFNILCNPLILPNKIIITRKDEYGYAADNTQIEILNANLIKLDPQN